MKTKKSLGQNWLTSKSVAQKMLEAARLTSDDVVLEIGPGLGFLTEALLEKAGRVVAVEKDGRLIGQLQTRFKTEIQTGKLHLIHGDISDEALGSANGRM